MDNTIINMIDRVNADRYEIYGVIGFRRYEYVSWNEAKKRYIKEAELLNYNN